MKHQKTNKLDFLNLDLSTLTDSQIIEAMLIFSKESSTRNLEETSNAIILAIANGLFHANTHRSMGYEDMALAFGIAFREVENMILDVKEKEAQLDILSSIMINNVLDDEVYH